jgi:hypothetical protein
MGAPKVGMTFESEKDAYEMYNAYVGMLDSALERAIQSVVQIKVYI